MADVEDSDEKPSKSALKREMTARQELGEALCQLSAAELASIPIEDPALLEAIIEAGRIHSNSASRRHRQFIGKLMRRIDPQPLEAALESLHQQRRDAAGRFHELEALRDLLLERGDEALGQVLERFAHADRQQLRQLTREARRSAGDTRGSAAARRLFRYLRELQE